MSTRKIMDGREVTELDQAVVLTVTTKCPEKWMLVDRETGEMYEGYVTEGKHSWSKLQDAKWVSTNEPNVNA